MTPPTDEELRALVELPELITTARRALFCLYIAVEASVANDVGAKVEAVFIQVPDLLKRLSQAEGERDELKASIRGEEGSLWPQEVRDAIDALEEKYDIELCSVAFAAKHDRLRERAEALAQSHKDRADRLAGAATSVRQIVLYPTNDLMTDSGELNSTASLLIADTLLAALQDDGGAK